MRIAFYGNVANNFYQIVKALRVQSQVDAHVYIDRRDPMSMRPESDLRALKNNYPDWIHEGDYVTRMSMLFPWRSKLVKELEAYDAVVVSYLGPMFAQFIRKPAFFFVTGSDLTLLPFPREFGFLYQSFKSKVTAWVKGFWLRRGIRVMAAIWTQPYSPYVHALQKLRIDESRIARIYFPLIIDANRFKVDENARYVQDKNMQRIVSSYDFVVFHPSRIMMRDQPQFKASGQWKRNELLFRGFGRFIQQSGAQRSVLVMPDRTQSNDLALGKEMIREMGLDQHVLWIKPPRPEGFTRDELVAFYSVADVVADDFGIGWFGSIVLEASAVGCPVVTYVDENVMSRLYPWHPLLSADTEEKIAEHLTVLYRDPTRRREIGQKGREWIQEFHSEESASAIYIKNLTQLCEDLTRDRSLLLK
jgi:glycosyltransferase involved in cell wall biosynthesis